MTGTQAPGLYEESGDEMATTSEPGLEAELAQPKPFEEKLFMHGPGLSSATATTLPKLATLGASYADSLKAAHIHANHCDGGEFEFPRGQALVFDAKAPFTDASFLHTNMNGQLVISAILPSAKLCDDYFSKRLCKLSKLCEESEMPPRMCALDKCSGRDKKVWRAVLGRRGYVGVYKCEERANCPSYYIAAYINETPCGYDAWHYAQEQQQQQQQQQEVITIGQLAESPRLAAVRRLARRNAQRILAEAASLLDVSINRIRDLSACPLKPGGKLPLLAVPNYSCEFNVVRLDGDHVHVYDHCIDMAAAENGLILPLDPRSGLWVMRALVPGRGILQCDESADSFPLGLLNTNTNTGSASSTDVSRFTWQGKDEGQSQGQGEGEGEGQNEGQGETTPKPVPSMLDASYRKPTPEEKKMIRSLCGANDGAIFQRLKFVPVIVRVSTD
jgi:hypothetical protein